MIAAALAALGGPGHAEALLSLRAVAESATTGARPRVPE
jgi:hypothetical protein